MKVARGQIDHLVPHGPGKGTGQNLVCHGETYKDLSKGEA